MKRFAALVVLVAVGAIGCSSDPAPKSWNTLAVVTSVERSAKYQAESDPPAPSGKLTFGRATLTVGPMTLGLLGGGRLEVSASTPGGNACVSLLTVEERRLAVGTANPDDADVAKALSLPTTCVIIGSHSGSHLDRFEVLEATPEGLAVAGDILGRVDETYLTKSGYAFPLADDPELLCGGGVTLEDVLGGREVRALVDPATGEITQLGCVHATDPNG